MNREIKFRAWSERWKEMFDDVIIYSDQVCDNSNNPIQEPVLMQFTGIKDKGNKDIYEGDVVCVYNDENLFVVKFGTVSRNVQTYDKQSILNLDFNCFYFESLNDGRKYFSITNNCYGEHDLKGTLIVGNIFNNPEFRK